MIDPSTPMPAYLIIVFVYIRLLSLTFLLYLYSLCYFDCKEYIFLIWQTYSIELIHFNPVTFLYICIK